MKKIRNLFNKTSVKFGASATILNIVLMISNILVIYWISPKLMGLWNSFMIFISYIYIIQMGIINGFSRELPFFFGAKKFNIVNRISSITLLVVNYSTIVSIVASLLLTLYFFLFFEPIYFYSSFVFGLLASIQFYNNYLLSTYRSSDAFDKLTNVFTIQIFFVFITIFLVPLIGYEGNLVRLSIIGLTQLLFLHYYRPLKVKPLWNLKLFKHLFHVGSRLFIFNYVYWLIPTFVRIIILQLGTTLHVGLYSPAIAVNTLMMLLPNTLSQYFYPKMSAQLGKSKSTKAVLEYSFVVMKKMFYILFSITLIGLFTLSFFIKTFLPDYINGIVPAQLAVISGLFSGLGLSLYTALITLKKFKLLSILLLLKALLFYSLIYFFGLKYSLLYGVSIGLLISETLFFAILVSCTFIIFKKIDAK